MKKKTLKVKSRTTRTRTVKVKPKAKARKAPAKPRDPKLIVQRKSSTITLRRTPHEAKGRGGYTV